MKRIQINEKEFIDVCKNSKSMREASIKLNMPFTTFSRYAKKLGVYNTNQSGKGMSKNRQSIPLQDIFDGNHKYYQSSKLRTRLINEGYKENKCEQCGLSEWNELPLSLELEHVDGNCENHKLENLKILCPNCHSQTKTYRGKNKTGYKINGYVSDDDLKNAIKMTNNFRQALLKVGLAPEGGNYKRLYKLMQG